MNNFPGKKFTNEIMRKSNIESPNSIQFTINSLTELTNSITKLIN